MVVPAGLVNNWHRELNEVFHLNFEVFGSEGDVTDRKSNAFEKHNLLIASIDTLKLRAAHGAVEGGSAVGLGGVRRGASSDCLPAERKTGEDAKLQARRDAQGAHSRFGIALRHTAPRRPFPLLDAGADARPDVVQFAYRDGRAPAPAQHGYFSPHKSGRLPPDGSTLVCTTASAYRGVHDVRRREGVLRGLGGLLAGWLRAGETAGQTRPRLGVRDDDFPEDCCVQFRRRATHASPPAHRAHDSRSVDARPEARHRPAQRRPRRSADADSGVARHRRGTARGRGSGQITGGLPLQNSADAAGRRRSAGCGADEFASETGAAEAEDAAISSVSVALPEERRRIKELLGKYPPQRETKVEKLIGALGVLWRAESAGADGRIRHVSRQRRDARRGN